MNDRSEIQQGFLSKSGWADAVGDPIAGDASSRQYQRLTQQKSGVTAILMDAPPSAGSMHSFVSVAEFLQGSDLSAPKILDQDIVNGFLLLEDLGDDLFTSVITKNPAGELKLYEAAVDVICKLHDLPNSPNLPQYDARGMAKATDLAFLFYCSQPTTTLDQPAQSAITWLEDRLSQFNAFNKISLRDYHAENLIWLPDRAGPARVGLLDFQDAVLTHPAYDLMSLVRDARRDVSDETSKRVIAMYCRRRDYDETKFRTEAALISVQRNLRILGIFARLSRVMNKPHYVDLIPRVWGHLQTDLCHPSLSELRDMFAKILPPPTPEFLAHLRTPCQTLQ